MMLRKEAAAQDGRDDKERREVNGARPREDDVSRIREKNQRARRHANPKAGQEVEAAISTPTRRLSQRDGVFPLSAGGRYRIAAKTTPHRNHHHGAKPDFQVAFRNLDIGPHRRDIRFRRQFLPCRLGVSDASSLKLLHKL